jgi:hypothetical protein
MASEEVAATTPSTKKLFIPAFVLPRLYAIYEPMEGVVDINSDLEDLIRYGACVLAIIDHKHIKIQDPMKKRLSEMVEVADCLLEDGDDKP